MSRGSIRWEGSTWTDALQQAIESRLDALPGRELSQAAATLSARYRGDGAPASAITSPSPSPSRTPAAASSPTRSSASTSSTASLSEAPAGTRHQRRTPAARGAGPALTDAERLAYLAVRAPATGAAVHAVLRELLERAGSAASSIRTLLDLGAGPGVGTWAALDQLDALDAATLVERDAGSVTLGQTLAHDAGLDKQIALTWRRADLRDTLDLPPHDLVLLSYSIGELDEAAAARVIARAWDLARVALVLVEPGTPRHFTRLLTLRQSLIERGARLVAPCPHARACPMIAPDWCHFAARLGRSSLHRRLKQGALSYEDEKYSYVAFLRDDREPNDATRATDAAGAADVAGAADEATPRPASSRIVRRPEYHKGFVRLPVCAADGLRVETITKSQRALYRDARDAAWGAPWPPPSSSASAGDEDVEDAGARGDGGAG